MADAIVKYPMETQVLLELPDLPQPEGLAEIGKRLAANPADVEAWIQRGQVLRGVMNFREEIDAYSKGLLAAPENPVLYLHRGHAYLNVRRYPEGAVDLEHAARLDQSIWDIWYHYGLAYYLMGAYDLAAKGYEHCLAIEARPGFFIAATDWYSLTLMRQGRIDEMLVAAKKIKPDGDIDEHDEYFNRVLVYNGSRTVDEVYAEVEKKDDHHFATGAYGLAVYCERVLNDREKALRILKEVEKRGSMWSGFAVLACHEHLKEYG